MHEKTPLEKAADAVGGASQLAALLGVTPQAVSNWKSSSVPVERCWEIEAACGGAVTRRDLRPDDWQRIWPELATAKV